jgi:hypothetical protein
MLVPETRPRLACVDDEAVPPPRIDRDAPQRAVRSGARVDVSLRVVNQPGVRTVTTALRGAIRDDAHIRQEFLAQTARTSP